MEKEQFETLKSLVMEVFTAASDYMEKRVMIEEPEALPERIREELVEDYPILRFMDDDEQKEALIGILVADGILPAEEDTEEFFMHILDKIHGRNKSHAHQNATLALRMLSEAYTSQIAVAIEPN